MADNNWYSKEIDSILKTFDVSRDKGLTNKQVDELKQEYGANEIKEEKGNTLLKMFINQFKDFMIVILLIAAIVSGMLGEITDTVLIFIIVILNAVIGVVQENRAEQSLRALKSMSTPNAKVLREGKIIEVKSDSIVPGDIVIIEAGDYVPADGRLIESVNLMIEESALTGESVPVNKDTSILTGSEVPLGDRKNMIFSTSMVTNGRGKFVTTGIGMDTEIGKIANMLKSQEDIKTPLQQKLEQLGKWLGIIALGICGIIFLMGYLQGRPIFDMFMLAVSLAVAAIPEGLPAIVTIVLSLGVQRMIKKNAIIRKLPAVETLGTASVICSDKTGTLTQNKMTVKRLYISEKTLDIDKIDLNSQDENLAIKIGVLCNDSSIEEDDGEKKTIGDPTEVALVALGLEKGIFKREEESKLARVNEIPFDSDRKMMTTIHKWEQGYKVFTKGAPDILLERCNRILLDGEILELNEDMKDKVIKENEDMASNALRVLALAYKDIDTIPQNVDSENMEIDLIFVALAGMIDPPREEVKAAVEKCKNAGIRPVMITGDYKITATTIAQELGIIEEGYDAIEGRELEKMYDEELIKNVEKYSVYARVSPEHKVRIVKAWQSNNKIVAMTGDGVNDAPALKRANIGCAMGITGTDVSKEASDMVLTDDNFATIVSAVEEGRNIFDNIKKSIRFLLSCNTGEIIALFTALIMNLPTPLMPIHLLWVNLVTDSFPALALGVDNPEPNIMDREPRDAQKGIFADGLGIKILVEGLIIGGVTMLAFLKGLKTDVITGETMAFITLSFSQLVHSYNVRSDDNSIIKIGIFSNKYLIIATLISSLLMLGVVFVPFLRDVFELTLLTGNQWIYVIVYAFIPLILMEGYKLLSKIIRH